MAEIERPCRYCIAGYRDVGETLEPSAQACEFAHRDDPRVYALARALASKFQQKDPTDVQVSYFLEDADEVVDDFDPAPDRWRVRLLPENESDSERDIVCRLRINDVTYVGTEGGKDTRGQMVKLATFRQWEREANQAVSRG